MNRLIDCIQQPNGNYGFMLDPTESKLKNIIYGLFYKNVWYVGKTQQEIRKRLWQHFSFARCGDSKTELSTILKKKPWKLRFKILEKVSKDEDINAKEIFWIKKLNAYKTGLNSNSGGGGSNTYPPSTPSIHSEPLEIKQLSTPTKKYPFSRNDEGEVVINFTPSASQIQNAVYGIGNKENEYVGETGNFVNRVRNHLYKARKVIGKKTKQKLHSQIQKSPERFSAYVLHTLSTPSHLRLAEKRVMDIRKVSKNLLNVFDACGGGLPARKASIR